MKTLLSILVFLAWGCQGQMVLRSGVLVSGKLPMSLRDGLTAYWKMDESSGTRIDASGHSFNLGANNNPLSNPGKISNAVTLVSASVQYLTVADNPSLQVTSNDWTIAFWVNMTNLTTSVLVGKFETIGNKREWQVSFNAGTSKLNLTISTNGQAVAGADVLESLSTFTEKAWHFVAAGMANGKNFLYLDTVTTNNTTSLPAFSGSANFSVGAQSSGGAPFNGSIDEMGFWSRRGLSLSELNDLYNAGLGKTYPF